MFLQKSGKSSEKFGKVSENLKEKVPGGYGLMKKKMNFM